MRAAQPGGPTRISGVCSLNGAGCRGSATPFRQTVPEMRMISGQHLCFNGAVYTSTSIVLSLRILCVKRTFMFILPFIFYIFLNEELVYANFTKSLLELNAKF